MAEDVLVGRAGELAGFDGRLAGARTRRGGLVLVEGDPGVGKTALAPAEVAELAGAGGIRAR